MILSGNFFNGTNADLFFFITRLIINNKHTLNSSSTKADFLTTLMKNTKSTKFFNYTREGIRERERERREK